MPIASNIINLEKTNYQQSSLFLGEPRGLVDTINKPYPQLERLYKKMKALDWDESEFDYSSCIRDFKTCSKDTYDAMIKTLAWQWEADTTATNCLAPIAAPFVTNDSLWSLWQEIGRNENVHARTYSEIVRGSFEDPDVIFAEILKVKEAHARLKTVASIMNHAYTVSHQLALGMVQKNQQTYEAIFLFVVALYFLERVQFNDSFTVTFGVCETGLFNPIGKAVQKIAQDEFEIHAKADRAILEIELATPRGQLALKNLKDIIAKLAFEVIESENAWARYVLPTGHELAGLTQNDLIKMNLFNAKEPLEFFGIEHNYTLPSKLPLRFMENWLNISNTQISPQEEKGGGYLLGQFHDNTTDKEFAIDF